MQVVYCLKNDRATIQALQKGMQSKDPIIGLKNTHGLFASPEWWKNIEIGRLQLYTECGLITKAWPGHHNDFPEFEVTTANNETKLWPMEKAPLLHEIGSKVEIDYVQQALKGGGISECVVEIRIQRQPN